MRATHPQFRWALFAGVLLSAIVAVSAAADAPCLTVNLARPVIFPDGTERPAGQLTLCDWKTYTPVAQIHRSYVDGRPVQMLIGTRTANERSADEPAEVFFRADGNGRLELMGYTRTLQGRGVTVSFQRKDSPRKVDHALARANERKDDLLIVMARPH